MTTNMWVAVSALATAVMAFFSYKLFAVNKSISDLTTAVYKIQQKADQSRDQAIRMALDFRLRTACGALREGMTNPIFFVMWCLHEWDWDKPPVAELSRILTEEQAREVLRAYEMMSLVTTAVSGLTTTLDRWGWVTKLIEPIPSNKKLQDFVKEQVNRALPTIEKARQVCKFDACDELLKLPPS